MNLIYRTTCRACKNPDLLPVIFLGNQKIQGMFKTPKKSFISHRKVPLEIVKCDIKNNETACGLIQNSITIPPEILYSSYFYRSGISNSMKKHLKETADEIVKLVEPGPKQVLDIAANDLTFLKYYPSEYVKTGIDPSDIILNSDKQDINVIHGYYPEDIQSHTKFYVITSLAVFYDINDPVNFAKSVAASLAQGGIWVCEFAYLPSVLENLAYDGMVFEHCSLYSLATFEYVLKQAGLKTFKVVKNNINGGSLQVWATQKTCGLYDTKENLENIMKTRLYEYSLELDSSEVYSRFQNNVTKHKKDLHKILLSLKKQNKVIHALGMSTKLNCLLQTADIGSDIISAASERDSEKWGGETLSGIPMISEEESRKKADVYLVGPYHFRDEIINREKKFLKKGGQLLFPLPKIEIVSQTGTQSI